MQNDATTLIEYGRKIDNLDLRVGRVEGDLYGGARPGHLEVTNEFMISLKAQFRLIVLLISVIGVVLAVLTWIEGNRAVKSGELNLPSVSEHEVYARSKIDVSTK